MSDYEKIDQAILKNIGLIRSEHHACTARHLSDTMRVSRNVVRSRLAVMQAAGLVTWTGVAGSLRVLGTPSRDVGTTDAGAPAESEQPASSPPQTEEAESPARRPAAKATTPSKAPAKKKAARKKAAQKRASA